MPECTSWGHIVSSHTEAADPHHRQRDGEQSGGESGDGRREREWAKETKQKEAKWNAGVGMHRRGIVQVRKSYEKNDNRKEWWKQQEPLG